MVKQRKHTNWNVCLWNFKDLVHPNRDVSSPTWHKLMYAKAPEDLFVEKFLSHICSNFVIYKVVSFLYIKRKVAKRYSFSNWNLPSLHHFKLKVQKVHILVGFMNKIIRICHTSTYDSILMMSLLTKRETIERHLGTTSIHPKCIYSKI